jgi:hypothetical protein
MRRICISYTRHAVEHLNQPSPAFSFFPLFPPSHKIELIGVATASADPRKVLCILD